MTTSALQVVQQAGNQPLNGVNEALGPPQIPRPGPEIALVSDGVQCPWSLLNRLRRSVTWFRVGAPPRHGSSSQFDNGLSGSPDVWFVACCNRPSRELGGQSERNGCEWPYKRCGPSEMGANGRTRGANRTRERALIKHSLQWILNGVCATVNLTNFTRNRGRQVLGK